jgi:hypothetical protein
MIFRQLFDSVSSTYSYLIASRRGADALIIDPVLEKGAAARRPGRARPKHRSRLAIFPEPHRPTDGSRPHGPLLSGVAPRFRSNSGSRGAASHDFHAVRASWTPARFPSEYVAGHPFGETGAFGSPAAIWFLIR